MHYYFHVEDQDQSSRIDQYLTIKLGDYSRSYLQKLFKENAITVNGKSVKSNYKIAALDIVEIDLPEKKEPQIVPEKMELDILYEDQDIILINKPKGMVVHPAAGHDTGTLVNGLLEHCPEGLSSINGVLRPGIVHRIDMDTTGILIVCKNDRIHQDIAAQLKEHSITRKYHAIVHGVLKVDRGTIDAPIGRDPNHRKKMSINDNGKAAITHYQVIERFQQYTYIECQLETGRTHQIRVHMTSIHHPLLGDQVYGHLKSPFALQGQTLHAKTLGFVHPRSKAYMEFEAPLPDYFQKLLLNLK